MVQYIEKDAIVSEIEKRIKSYISLQQKPEMSDLQKELQNKIDCLNSVKGYILNTLEVKEMNKVYVILKNSYEFDDLNYGELTSCYLSLDKDRAQETFNSIKEKEIKWFHQTLENYYKDFLEKYPQRAEDFKIAENTDDYLEIYLDKWCYQWKLTEYELEKMF